MVHLTFALSFSLLQLASPCIFKAVIPFITHDNISREPEKVGVFEDSTKFACVGHGRKISASLEGGHDSSFSTLCRSQGTHMEEQHVLIMSQLQDSLLSGLYHHRCQRTQPKDSQPMVKSILHLERELLST